MDAAQRDLQGIHVNRFGNEIGGLVFQALDGQGHVPVTGDHDHFRIRVGMFDPFQQLDPVDPRHFDIGHDDLRTGGIINLQGLFAVFRRVDGITHVSQRNLEHIANIPFIVDQ